MSNQSNQVPTITVGQYDNGNKLVFNLTKDNLVESISGATITSKAVTRAVNASLKFVGSMAADGSTAN